MLKTEILLHLFIAFIWQIYAYLVNVPILRMGIGGIGQCIPHINDTQYKVFCILCGPTKWNI